MIIDMHGHALSPGYPMGSRFSTNACKMVEVMERYGIGQIWLSHCGAMITDDTVHNRDLYENYVRLFPQKIIGYCVVDPYKGIEHCREEIRRCAEEYGFKGLKIHGWLQCTPMHAPYIYEIMELVREYHWPVLFHDGTPPYSDTSQIAALAEMFPDVPVILGHAGMYDSYRAAVLACRMLENIYLCLVGNTIGDIREILQNVRHDRILFGSDYCFKDDMELAGTMIADRRDALFAAAKGADINDILFQNAEQFSLLTV